MIHLFASKRHPYPSPRSQWQATLPTFISSIIRHSGFETTVAAVAITFLVRYKEAVPDHVAYNDEAYRLFFASYIVASKVVYDYNLGSLRFWKGVGSDMFSFAEIRMMETVFCRVLDWDFRVDSELFAWVKNVVDRHLFSMGVLPKPDDICHECRDTSPPPSYEDATRTQGRQRFSGRDTFASPCSPCESSSEEADQMALARMLFQPPELKKSNDDGMSSWFSSGSNFWSALKQRIFGLI